MMKIINRKNLVTAVMLLSASFSALAQSLADKVAESYKGTLCVTIDGMDYKHGEIDMTVEKNDDGTVTLSVKEFKLVRNGEEKPLGNIVLPNVALAATAERDVVSASTKNRNIRIEGPADGGDGSGNNTVGGSNQGGGAGFGGEGDDDEEFFPGSGGGSQDPEWFGPSYGELSVNTSGTMSLDAALLSFNVYVANLDKEVSVSFDTKDMTATIIPTERVSAFTGSAYSVSGVPALSSLHGIVIREGRKVVISNK